MKVYELAQAIGKQQSFVSRLENAQMKEIPSPEDLRQLHNVLGLTISSMVQAAGYDIGADEEPSGEPPGTSRETLRTLLGTGEVTEDEAAELISYLNARRIMARGGIA